MILLALSLTFSCGDKKQRETAPTAQKQKAKIELDLEERLRHWNDQGILFGHQDDLAYGIDWKYVKGNSDVKAVAGDYPAFFGWELGGLERGDAENLDSVPFDRMRALALEVHGWGGVNSFSWHPYDPIEGRNSWSKEADVVRHIIPGGEHHAAFVKQLDSVAKFFSSLKDKEGRSIPFIFRPWHEMDGDWFWWGSKQCSPQEFKQLFAFTIQYLKEEKGLNQMLVAYSPDRNFRNSEEYLQWYPGDGIVDILGMDNYGDLKKTGGCAVVIEKLHWIIDLAKTKNKVAAFTETGLENVTRPDWYDDELGCVLSDTLVQKEIAYVMVWRNDPDVHHFFPYPGHPGAESAKKLLSRPEILLLGDLNPKSVE